MDLSEYIKWNSVKGVLLCRNFSKEEFDKKFDNPNITYENFHKSKCGYMKIIKISNNEGYLRRGGCESGVTGAFGVGLSLYLSETTTWYSTSVIKDIDWDKNIFATMNSRYKFKFEEVDSNVILKQLEEYESKGIKQIK